MENIIYQYRFNQGDGLEVLFDIQLDGQTLDRLNLDDVAMPDWALLEANQCPHCPLEIETHPHCPVAMGIVDIARHFDNIVSFDEIDLEVITEERVVTQHTTAQRAISSLLGLVMATSGCPHTAFFKPMARFHLPLASEENTIYRVSGMYLLAQFFLQKRGLPADPGLNGLARIYQNMHQVNLHIAKRLKNATTTDSSVNAIVLLDSFTNTLPYVIEEHLDEIAYLFKPFYSDFYQELLNDAEPPPDDSG